MNERALRAAWKDRVFEIRVSRNNKTEMLAKFFFSLYYSSQSKPRKLVKLCVARRNYIKILKIHLKKKKKRN